MVLDRVCVGLAVAVAAAAAWAQSGMDVGLVNGISGAPAYQSQGVPAGKAKAYMRVREGDRFNVPAGTWLRLVYFQGGRQETWTGPASFRAGHSKSDDAGGAVPQIATLPIVAPQKMARVPDLVQSAMLAGVTVRGGAASKHPTLDAQERADVAQAREAYGGLRAQAAADDITPELYLMSVLHEYSLYDDMRGLIDQMQLRQPESEVVRDLARWVQARLGGPR